MLNPMTPKHSLWPTFIQRLEGPEGCNFTQDHTWECKGEKDKSKAIKILQSIPNIDLPASIEYFEKHGGYCDCEIVFNVH